MRLYFAPRRWTALLLSFLSVLGLSAIAAPPPNDTCAGRQLIPGNGPFPFKTATVDISEAGATGDPIATCQSARASSVWYEFRPQATSLYTISTCAEAGTATTVADTVMAIYVDSGVPCSGLVQVACEDDVCGTDGLQTAITTQLAANTTYYIVVWRYDDGPPPSSPDAQLQLLISPSEVPQNDVCSTPTELPLNLRLDGSTLASFNDYQLPGSAAQGREVVYGFTAPDNGRYSFSVRGYLGDDLIVYATTNCPTGIPPITIANAVSIADRNPASTAEELYCVYLTAGQRLFIFVDENNAADAGSMFTIEATKCVQESEPNNALATADTLPCGVQGSIFPIGDVDYFALGTFPTGYRAFAMVDASAGRTPEMDLRVETADEILEVDSGDNDEPFGQQSSNIAGTPLTNTPTYLRVSYINSTSTNEPYRLYAVVRPPLASASAEAEPNNTILQANAAAYVRGTLAVADDDVFSVTASAGDLIFVSLDGDPLRDSTRVQAQLAVLDSLGTTVFSVDDVNQLSYPPGEALVYRANQAGTYYIKVSASTTAMSPTGDYLLSIARNCFVNNGTNTPPVVANMIATSQVFEGSALTVRGDISDPDAGEAFEITIQWGDGSPNTVTNLPPGINSFEVSHLVIDDVPSGTSSDATDVTVTVTDRSGGAHAATVTPIVRNVDPSALSVSPAPSTLNEGAETSLTVAFTDPGAADTFAVSVNWGDGSSTTTNLVAGIRLIQMAHVFQDNSSLVTVVVQDDDGGSITNDTLITVNNVNPSLSNVTTTSPIPADGTVTLTGNYSDAGAADSFTLTVDWGDGSSPQNVNYPAGAGSFNLQHSYSLAGTSVQVTVTLRDDDNGTTSTGASVIIGPRVGAPARFFAISNAPGSQMFLQLTGTPNVVYRIEGSSNLQSWTTLGSRTATGDGSFTFEDNALPRPPRRFYRAVSP